jgi:hypothetical protein
MSEISIGAAQHTIGGSGQTLTSLRSASSGPITTLKNCRERDQGGCRVPHARRLLPIIDDYVDRERYSWSATIAVLVGRLANRRATIAGMRSPRPAILSRCSGQARSARHGVAIERETARATSSARRQFEPLFPRRMRVMSSISERSAWSSRCRANSAVAKRSSCWCRSRFWWRSSAMV